MSISPPRGWRWALLALAAIAPAAAIVAFPGLPPRGALLLICLGVALATVVLGHWSFRLQQTAAIAQEQVRPAVALARSAASRLDQLQRRISDLQPLGKEVELIKSLINGERHNLSLVAAGLAELRDTVGGEQVNLGRVAAALHELREAEAARQARADQASGKVEQFDDMMEAAHAHLTVLSSQVDALTAQVEVEQRNLGLVAGGLDALRRSVVGVEALNARCAALSDGLVMVADKVDTLVDVHAANTTAPLHAATA